jgi:hypothetical protein
LQNPTNQRIEAISARFNLQTGSENRTETVPLLVDGIPPQGALPVAAYFSAPIAMPYQISAELISAIPVNSKDIRHLPVELEKIQITARSQDQKTAWVNCTLRLSDASSTNRVWLLAIAYDKTGNIIGLRRVEIHGPFASNDNPPCTIEIYGMGQIADVQLFAEATP